MKNLNKLASLLLVLVMLVQVSSLSVVSFAADEEAGYVQNFSHDAKKDATDESIRADALKFIEKDEGTFNVITHTVANVVHIGTDTKTEDGGTMKFYVTWKDNKYDVVTLHYTYLEPGEYKFAKDNVKSIKADSEYNADANTLLNYFNSESKMIGTGKFYDEAFGEAPDRNVVFTWDDSDKEYNSYGGLTYTFTKLVDEEKNEVVVRKLVVDAVTMTEPKVVLNYNTMVFTGTNSKMSYSVDGTNWTVCTENMPATEQFFGKTVYFKYPETNYYKESKTIAIYVPAKATMPATALQLSATSHSVTIENAGNFYNYGVEFAIQSGNNVSTTESANYLWLDWRRAGDSSYTFDDLSADTDYTVYAYIPAISGTRFASNVVTATIKTSPKPTNKVTVSETSTNNGNNNYSGYNTNSEATIVADIDIASEVYGSRIIGEVTQSDLNDLKTKVNEAYRKYRSVNLEIALHQYTSGVASSNGTTTTNYDIYDISEIEFTLPTSILRQLSQQANMTITYDCDWLTYEIDDSNIGSGTFRSIVYDIISTPSNYTLKDIYNSGRPLYRVNITNGNKSAAVTYLIPYVLKANESVNGLKVVSVASNANNAKETNLSYTYDTSKNVIRVSTSQNGYIGVAYSSANAVFPFYDVPNNHWAYSYVKYCYDKGLFYGVTNNAFAPDTPITRGMIYTLLARLSGVDTNGTVYYNPYTDIMSNDWYAKAAVWAYDNKLVQGNTFNPNSTMTRAEIAVVLQQYMTMRGYSGYGSYNTANVYDDCQELDSATQQAIMSLKQSGLMLGTGDNKFTPEGTFSRCQMATILYRLSEQVRFTR